MMLGPRRGALPSTALRARVAPVRGARPAMSLRPGTSEDVVATADLVTRHERPQADLPAGVDAVRARLAVAADRQQAARDLVPTMLRLGELRRRGAGPSPPRAGRSPRRPRGSALQERPAACRRPWARYQHSPSSLTTSSRHGRRRARVPSPRSHAAAASTPWLRAARPRSARAAAGVVTCVAMSQLGDATPHAGTARARPLESSGRTGPHGVPVSTRGFQSRRVGFDSPWGYARAVSSTGRARGF
jgi:hypothetical protein